LKLSAIGYNLKKQTLNNHMFEAKLAEGHILKKIIEAIKDIVTDVNIDVSPSGKY
jgi:hypothetical protein